MAGPSVGAIIRSGWVAVSATALTSADRSQLAWLRGYCPVNVLDGSILVYRFSRSPTPAADPVPAARAVPRPVELRRAPRRAGLSRQFYRELPMKIT